jgi:hypothetical protein
MKKIIVAYWGEELDIPFFKDNSVFDYSPAKQAEAIQVIINAGYSAMVRPNLGEDNDTLLIYIDNGRFKKS